MLVRLEAAEHEAFEEAAGLAGMALSGWVRDRLRSASRRELIESGRQVPFLQTMRRETDVEHSGD